MILRKLSVVFLSLCAVAPTCFSQSETTRATRTWDVKKFDISATLPQTDADRFISVVAALDLRNISSGNASGVTLRISPNAEISSVKINGSASDFTKGEEKTGAGTLQRIIVRGLAVSSGEGVQVEVAYRLKVEENSGLATLSPFSSQFLPLSFWYPTPTSWFFARGGDYAPMTIHVNGAGGNTVVAPGRPMQNSFVEQKLSAQPFFLTGRWEVAAASGIDVMVPSGATSTEKDRAKDIAIYASEAKAYFTKLLGPLPEASIKIVGVRRGGGFSGGDTILLDQSAFRRSKLDSQTAVIVADGIAKIWIGSAVKATGDGYGVIREGLPRYLATQFVEQRFGSEIAEVERIRQRLAYGAIAKRDGAITQISPLDDFYASSMTNKGAIIWRQLIREVGSDRFFGIMRSAVERGQLDLSELRQSFPDQKVFLDYAFDQVTDGNILIGLPRTAVDETRIALRNTGPVDVTVNVRAVTETGKVLNSSATVLTKSFGEAVFKTTSKIVSAEVDPEKYFLQQDYSDDVSPRRFDQSDLVLVVKSSFDRQDYGAAEKDARDILAVYPRFDEVRTLLARALLAAGKSDEADKEFRSLLEERLPSARTLAWAQVGLGEIALKAGRNGEALERFDAAIRADAELGATFAARKGRSRIETGAVIDPSIKEFFVAFDKAALSNRKAEVDALIVPGEMLKFSRGLAGQAQEWATTVLSVDKFGPDSAIVEVGASLRLINKASESGTITYRMQRVNGIWKLSGIETFEVR